MHARWWMAAWVLGIASVASASTVTLVTEPGNAPGRLAAEEMSGYLRQLYPADQFVVTEQVPDSGRRVILRTDGPTPDAYAVTVSGDQAVIRGGGPRGLFHGVYGLLDRLGCGFYLSYETVPAPRGAFSFEGWEGADAPLVGDRLVFNWHNFLSGCSTWNLPEWRAWIIQSQKMGYNAVMVHAYGNNPMVRFTFNGKTKPVGYITTTASGRDWSTMHVNDVRRLRGGQVFAQPVFGSDAAMVPDADRADAARKLMQEVFACAGQRGMNVFFAVDVDTASANPQDLICALPAADRFRVSPGGLWLANPDTPGGYAFYKAQVDALLADYPQITTLVVWFRNRATPWMDMPLSDLPDAWQKEYKAEVAKTPAAAKLWKSHNVFAIGKVVAAFQRALNERGRGRVELAAGTWDFDFLAPGDRFFLSDVKLIGLDYGVLRNQPQLKTEASRKVIREVAGHRPVVPVIWAQHDDGNYFGRAYTPFASFQSKLADSRACGFGIIHWMTRPLDLFFTSHAKQVWQATKDQQLSTTCEEMAMRSFGPEARAPMGEYLERWATEAPIFGRETSDWFIDRALAPADRVTAGCRDRLKLIDQVKPDGLTQAQRDRLNYHRGLEEFISSVHQSEERYRAAGTSIQKEAYDEARTLIAANRPEQTVENFARFSAPGGMTRGEQGLLVSLNLRWLTHMVRQRQSAGVEPVRIRFAPTQHDPLAQSPGTFTFYADPDRALWECLGEKETGAHVFTIPVAQAKAGGELATTGIESERPITFILRPMMAVDSRNRAKPARLPPGAYQLHLFMVDPTSTAVGQRVMDVVIKGAVSDAAGRRVDVFAEAGGAGRLLEKVYPVNVDESGVLAVTLKPVTGKAVISAAVLKTL